MTPASWVDVEELLRGEPIHVDFRDFSIGAARWLSLAMRLVGADGTSSDRRRGRVVTLRRLGELTTSELDALREAAASEPVLICPGDAASAGLDVRSREALAHLAGEELEFAEPGAVSAFAFAKLDRLWPFSGVTLRETIERTVPAVDPRTSQIEPLVTTERGAVFLKLRSRHLYVTLVPLAESPRDGLLKHELTPATFMSLVPLLLFLRRALGERGWLQSSVRATFVVDDPNLRFGRYGYLNFERLVEAAREHDFHTSIAMIPLDFRKTRPAVAQFFLHHREWISVVPHGVDHLWGEFSADVALSVAESTLFQGLLRMEAHKRATGIRYPRTVTFPHGLGNATWMQAMRNIGMEAAINKRSFPFLRDADIRNPFYEARPAEMTFLGFPIIKRFQAEKPTERFLFAALLGQPLIVYTHHGFFREGLEPLLKLAEFLNRHVSPRWADVETILRSNFQIKRLESGSAVRVFSNRIVLPADRHSPVHAVLKPGTDFPADEQCRLGPTVVPMRRFADGLAALVPEGSDGHDVLFGPTRQALDLRAIQQPRLRSRARRWATELRDQVLLPASRRFAGS